ncbi:MAG: hypothetical protein KKF62_12040 [Bacteroidetes bacterium]|nr:hypothetical protein [Bacteroidota bacterium]MBU1113552.1 hypothetical protein [Bacteroidota bacterium]MBU1800286.1 hypothetical protein [Bacteroidota bacterium]
MLLKRTVILFFIVTSSLLSQNIGVWKNYTNMEDVMNISSTNAGFWIATTGGAGYFLNSSNEFDFFLTNSEGLSSQNVTSVDIDNTGNIWLGMQNGLIDVYNPNDKSTVTIRDIYESPNTSKQITDILIIDNIAYVSTEFGLSLINTSNLGFISSTSKFGNFPSTIVVNSVTVDNKIYISTESGIAIQKDGATNLVAPESWESYSVVTDIAANNIYRTIKFGSSIISATDKGLFSFNGTNWIHYFYSDPILDIEVFENKLIVLFNNSLHTYDGTTDRTIYTSSNSTFRKMNVTEDGTILIASNMGTIRITENSDEVLLPNGPINNSFESLAVDKNGALWVGTGKDEFGNGFMKFENGFWTNYNTTTFPELPNNNYHNVSADNNQVYLSNWGSGLTIEKDGVFSYLNANNSELVGIPGHPNYVVIMNAQRDSKGDLWFFNHASDDGKPLIQLTSDSTWYHYTFPFAPLTLDNFMLGGLIDEYDTKWFNVLGRGLFYFNENSSPADNSNDVWGQLTTSEGLNSNYVNAIALDKRGELWIGTTSGMNVLSNTSSPKSLITSVLAFALRQQSITAIAVDPLNYKWVGTYQGLFVMSPDGSHLIAQYDSKNSPLPSDNILSLAIDESTGLVYIGTSLGLSTLTTSSLEPKQEFSKILTYPSPFKIGVHEYVTFDGLVKNSTIKILSISGKLIKTLETPGGRITFWDGKDENGKFVSSGIYLLVAFDEEADKITTSKFAVIR